MTRRRDQQELEQLRQDVEELLNQVVHSKMPPRFADVVRRVLDRLNHEGE